MRNITSNDYKELMEIKKELEAEMIEGFERNKIYIDEKVREFGPDSREALSLIAISFLLGSHSSILETNDDDEKSRMSFLIDLSCNVADFLIEGNVEYLEGYKFILPYINEPLKGETNDEHRVEAIFNIVLAVNVPSSYYHKTGKLYVPVSSL